MLEKGSLLVYRYEIIKQIGSGGMSLVYKAKDKKLNRLVAVKVLKREFCNDETFVKRFKIEAQSAASLSHPNIVNVYDVGVDKDKQFIVMEYLEGITLKEYMNGKGILPDEEILEISSSIAKALVVAHENHIIHRDIKPQNIMITEAGEIKVMDFGIARSASSNTTTIDMSNDPSGSVYYISPEQAKGGYQDYKSDIYSLGITMFEMACGQLPYNGENAVAIAIKHIQEEFPRPSVVNPSISVNIESIIIKSTMKRAVNRYKNANEMLEDITACSHNPEEIICYPENENIENTMFIDSEEINQIWTRKEVQEYKDRRDPVRGIITAVAVIFAMVLVLGSTYYVYNNYMKNNIATDVEVPKVVGLEMEDARKILEDKELNIELAEEVFDDTIEKGIIIKQDPGVESIVLKNEKVKVTLSKGKETFDLPDVTGFNYDKAKSTIEKAGFKMITEVEFNDEVLVGRVIRQFPKGNVQVAKDTEVKIYVSKGPSFDYVEVLDVRNLNEEEAISILEQQKLEVGDIAYVYSDKIEEGKVVSMTVEPGKEVKEGYVIDLAVSKGAEIIEKTKSFIINNTLTNGETSTKLKIEYINNETKETSILYDEKVTAKDFPLTVEATNIGAGIIHVYNDDVQQYEFYFSFNE